MTSWWGVIQVDRITWFCCPVTGICYMRMFADEAAAKMGISKATLYRMEKRQHK